PRHSPNKFGSALGLTKRFTFVFLFSPRHSPNKFGSALGLTKRFVFSIGSAVFGRKSGDAFGSDTAKIAHRRFRSVIRITDCLTIITVVA
ncbi:hypothetical protein, partial [Alistipes communis]|uniref:hypothetical protein n=2 Tax=Alistipes communis TaxID=2585118 RepID=UPI00248BF204